MKSSENKQSNSALSNEEQRRAFLKYSAAGFAGALAAVAPAVRGQTQAANPEELQLNSDAFEAVHELKPLSFDPAKLNGLSAKLIESHWSNNYGGSVRALNAAKQRLAAALSDQNLPAFVYNGLKREHLMRTGSVVLHEMYFDNLGGNARADATVRSVIGKSFSDFNTWETEFRRIASGLGGGSGWVILGYNKHLRTLENFWLADHLHYPAATEPLLVIDMYEHSYQMDYGAATARYIDAFFNNINWERVLSRIDALS